MITNFQASSFSQTAPHKVLIIEDEPDVVDLLKLNFRNHGGFTTLIAADGPVGLHAAHTQAPDLIILDLMLPRMSGLELCKILKNDPNTAGIFVIMLTAKAETADRILGLKLGADDYVIKPFSPREVVLRANRILRSGRPGQNQAKLVAGPIILDESRHHVEVDGTPICLAGTEFRLLAWLMQRPRIVHTRDQLLNQVWGYERVLMTRTVDTHMGRLRKKLGQAGGVIETVRSYGYRLRDP